MTDQVYPPKRPNMAHRGAVTPQEKIGRPRPSLTPASLEQLKRSQVEKPKVPH